MDETEQRWLKTCNGQLPGNIVGAATAAWCASQPGVTGSLDTELVWTVPALNRTFRLEPLTAEQLAAWYARQGVLPARPEAAGAGA